MEIHSRKTNNIYKCYGSYIGWQRMNKRKHQANCNAHLGKSKHVFSYFHSIHWIKLCLHKHHAYFGNTQKHRISKNIRVEGSNICSQAYGNSCGLLRCQYLLSHICNIECGFWIEIVVISRLIHLGQINMYPILMEFHRLTGIFLSRTKHNYDSFEQLRFNKIRTRVNLSVNARRCKQWNSYISFGWCDSILLCKYITQPNKMNERTIKLSIRNVKCLSLSNVSKVEMNAVLLRGRAFYVYLCMCDFIECRCIFISVGPRVYVCEYIPTTQLFTIFNVWVCLSVYSCFDVLCMHAEY